MLTEPAVELEGLIMYQTFSKVGMLPVWETDNHKLKGGRLTINNMAVYVILWLHHMMGFGHTLCLHAVSLYKIVAAMPAQSCYVCSTLSSSVCVVERDTFVITCVVTGPDHPSLIFYILQGSVAKSWWLVLWLFECTIVQ